MSIVYTPFQVRVFYMCLIFLTLCSCSKDSVVSAQSLNHVEKPVKRFMLSEGALIFPELNGNIMDVMVHDWNEDRLPDLILAREDGFNILLTNDEGKSWSIDTEVLAAPNSGDSEDIALADFNGDGRLDIFFANEDTYRNELFLATVDGFLYSMEPLPATGRTNAAVAFDYDFDGDQDIYLGNDGVNALMLNKGNGQFQIHLDSVLCTTMTCTQDIEHADINGDGILDLVLANEESNQLFIRQANGSFINQSHLLKNPKQEETRELRAYDIDLDGDLDLFFCNVTFGKGAKAKNRVLINEGGSFRSLEDGAIPLNDYNTVDVEFADLDQDGTVEAILINAFGGGVQVLSFQGGEFVNRSTEFLPESAFYHSGVDLELFDFNDDGRIDIYASGFQSSDIILIGQAE